MSKNHIEESIFNFKGGICMPIKELNYDSVDLLNTLQIKDPLEALTASKESETIGSYVIKTISYNISSRISVVSL